jgi:hypothetical protein
LDDAVHGWLTFFLFFCPDFVFPLDASYYYYYYYYYYYCVCVIGRLAVDETHKNKEFIEFN